MTTSRAAIGLWMRSTIRRDWRGLALITVGVAVGLAFAMVAVTGARRAGSAWERFSNGQLAPDLIGDVPFDQLDTTLATLADRPGVTDVTAFGYLSVSYDGYRPAQGGRTRTLGAFAGLTPSFLRTIYRPLVLEGRAADPTRADELTINEATARLTGLRPGDRIVVTSDPEIVRQPATVVGIDRGLFDLLNTDQPSLLMTPAFGARWFGPFLDALDAETRNGYPVAVIVRVPNVADRAALTKDGYADAALLGGSITGGLDAQRTAFEVLALVAAVAVTGAAAQALSRRVRHDAGQVPTLAALGLTPAGRGAAMVAAPALAASAGCLVAPFLAVAASPLATTGLQRQLVVHRAFVVDLPVLALGALAAVLVFVTTAGIAAIRTDTAARARHATPHPSPLALPGPAGLFGGRVAAGWASSSGRTVARAHVLAVAVALAATSAAAVWSATVNHVVSDPSSYGQTWDAVISDPDENPDPTAVDTARQTLVTTPALGTTLGLLTAGMVDVEIEHAGGRTEVLEIDQAAGRWWPSIIAGRAPETDDEITMGRAALGNFGKAIGDSVLIADHRYTIVGTHVVPVFANGDFGNTIAIPLAGAADLVVYLSRPWAVVDLGENVTVDELQQALGDGVVVLSGPGETARPGPIANLARVGGIKGLLVAVCVLLTLASFTNGLLLGSFARRRDYATMRALGARRTTLNGSVAWHAAVVAVLAVSVGAALGLLVGQVVWRSTAAGLNIAPELFHPWLVVAVVGLLSFAGAALVALATAWSAVRPSNAALRPE